MRSPTGREVRSDSWGDGRYGASRGSRRHEGTDFIAVPGQDIYAPITGQLTRVVYPYEGDLTYMGCEILGDHCRIYLLYMVPAEDKVMAFVTEGDVIGVAQDISKKYSRKMIPHVHLRIKSLDVQLLMNMP